MISPLGFHNAVQAAEPLKMRGGSIGEHGNMRTSQPDSEGDLAKPTGTQLDDGAFMPRVQRQQSQRDSDVIIEIATCNKHVVRHAQYLTEHFLDCCLALTSGDGDHQSLRA